MDWKKKELNLKVKYIFFIVVEPNEIYVFKNKKKPCTFIKFGCVLLKWRDLKNILTV